MGIFMKNDEIVYYQHIFETFGFFSSKNYILTKLLINEHY